MTETMDFTNDTVVLLKYKGDDASGAPEYERYTLENVMVREIFAVDPSAVDEGGVTVYFLDNVSVCRAEAGEETALPRPSKGDLCSLHGGSAAEVTMRVAEAGYFTGGTLAHVRLKLK
ncbi:MAG: hypothetical protein ACI4V1_07065 [Eubacteriales bacterium]